MTEPSAEMRNGCPVVATIKAFYSVDERPNRRPEE